MNNGSDAAFKARLTLLGDGTCVLAITVAHVLLDAGRMMDVMHRLSMLYTGTPSKSDGLTLLCTSLQEKAKADMPLFGLV